VIDQVNISSFSFFTSISRMYSILPYLLVLDNEGKNLRPIWKSYNNLCKIHFTHIKSISLYIQVIILLLKIYFKKMTVHSTFFIIGSYSIMQKGGLAQFGCDITKYIKSTHINSQSLSVLPAQLLLRYIVLTRNPLLCGFVNIKQLDPSKNKMMHYIGGNNSIFFSSKNIL
jgi:hypothetical protein